MIQSKTIPGESFRLASRDGTVIGRITVPYYVARLLDHRDEVLFRLPAQDQAPGPDQVSGSPAPRQPGSRYARLCRSATMADALELSGATLEELRDAVRRERAEPITEAVRGGRAGMLGLWSSRDRSAAGGKPTLSF